MGISDPNHPPGISFVTCAGIGIGKLGKQAGAGIGYLDQRFGGLEFTERVCQVIVGNFVIGNS